jgi:oxaloacetate decarboxylase gamma subunit
MTIIEMLQQSTVLAVLGMTVVFVFLWIMIICVNLTGKLIHKMGLDKDIEQLKYELPKKSSGAVSSGIIAAISTGIAEYQKKE